MKHLHCIENIFTALFLTFIDVSVLLSVPPEVSGAWCDLKRACCDLKRFLFSEISIPRCSVLSLNYSRNSEKFSEDALCLWQLSFHCTIHYKTNFLSQFRFVVVFVVTAWYNIMTFQECLSPGRFYC